MPGLTTFLVLLQGGKLCVCVTWDSLGGGRQWGPKSCPILSLVTDLQGSWAGRPSFTDVTMRWEQQSPTDRTQGQCLRGQWMHRDCVPVWQPIFITQSLPTSHPAPPANRTPHCLHPPLFTWEQGWLPAMHHVPVHCFWGPWALKCPPNSSNTM